MQVVIPAAGRGSRFDSVVRRSPKELLMLGDRPIIHHALDEAARGGMERAVLVLAPWKVAIRDYLTRIEPPLPLDFAIQEEPLGIGDSILRAGIEPPFGVLLPDDVIETAEPWPSLIQAHSMNGGAALCVRRVPPTDTHRFGIATIRGSSLLDVVEKPLAGEAPSDLAVFGRYIVTDAVLSAIGRPGPTGEIELTDAFRVAAATFPGVCVVWYGGRILDCGTPAAYERSVALLKNRSL